MKQFFFLSILTLVCAKAEAMIREIAPPNYRIVSSEPQLDLDANHAVFELQFSAYLTAGSVYDIRCNGVFDQVDANVSPVKEISVSPGKYQFHFTTASGVCIVTDSIAILPGYRTVLSVTPALPPIIATPGVIVVCKPVIYLYPEEDLSVEVNLAPKGNFTFTYPDYANGWNGTAHPDGSVTIAGKNYPYLFWEAEQDNVAALGNYSAGFQVNQDEVVAFLEEKLTQMGFNDTEKTDFITYWAPRMVQSEQGFAHFLFNTGYDELAALSVSPKPDAIFRVYLLWTPLENGILPEPKAQELPKMSRTGFHVLEWGGSELPALQVLTYKQ